MGGGDLGSNGGGGGGCSSGCDGGERGGMCDRGLRETKQFPHISFFSPG